jgi:hypothetical protein
LSTLPNCIENRYVFIIKKWNLVKYLYFSQSESKHKISKELLVEALKVNIKISGFINKFVNKECTSTIRDNHINLNKPFGLQFLQIKLLVCKYEYNKRCLRELRGSINHTSCGNGINLVEK